MRLTNEFVAKGFQPVIPEYADPNYKMFNSGGVEVEVAEFLYSFVQMIKAQYILETGTHMGISSCYMGQALKELGRGEITTLEIIPEHFNYSADLFRRMDLLPFTRGLFQSSLSYTYDRPQLLDILFLDSEPQLRFNEFLRFWANVRPGGFIFIHDLDRKLGHSGQMVKFNESLPPEYDWPYGDFLPKLGNYIKGYLVQTLSFETPRGLTIFQKVRDDAEYIKLLRKNDRYKK
jgi:predicted O-methyltransferase YrrM